MKSIEAETLCQQITSEKAGYTPDKTGAKAITVQQEVAGYTQSPFCMLHGVEHDARLTIWIVQYMYT